MDALSSQCPSSSTITGPESSSSEPNVTGGDVAGTWELRVYGVGGSPGSRLLGFESLTDVEVVGEGVGGTEVLARRNDLGVEGYNWG